ADAAEADQQDRSAVGMVGETPQRCVGGEPRAHQRAGERGGERRVIDEIARMRHQHVGGEAAVEIDADMARGGAVVLLAVPARNALAAADPGVDRDLVAGLRVRGVETDAIDHAGDLVAEREGQGAALADVELLVAAEPEVAVLHVHVGMAHAAALDPHKHLAAARLGRLDDGLAQRRRVGDERLADELCHASFRSGSWRARATKPSTGISSARAVSAMPTEASRGFGSNPRVRRLWRSILRRWPKAASVTRSSAARSQPRGSGRGTRRTTDE